MPGRRERRRAGAEAPELAPERGRGRPWPISPGGSAEPSWAPGTTAAPSRGASGISHRRGRVERAASGRDRAGRVRKVTSDALPEAVPGTSGTRPSGSPCRDSRLRRPEPMRRTMIGRSAGRRDRSVGVRRSRPGSFPPGRPRPGAGAGGHGRVVTVGDPARRFPRGRRGFGNDRRVLRAPPALSPPSPGWVAFRNRTPGRGWKSVPGGVFRKSWAGASGTRSRDSRKPERGPMRKTTTGRRIGSVPGRRGCAAPSPAPRSLRPAPFRSGPGGGRLRRLRRRSEAPRLRVPRRRGPGCPPPPRGRWGRRGRRSSVRRRGPRVRRRSRR